MKSGPPITPLVLPRTATAAVVLGGSFDPPHLWHVRIAIAARDHCVGTSGWKILVPAARSPLKAEGPKASDVHRVAMLRLASAEMKRAVVWTDEIDRAGAGESSYTIDTIERLLTIHPRLTLRLVIGQDQAATFHRWRRFADLLRLAEPAVVLRGRDTKAEFFSQLSGTGAWSDQDLARWEKRIVPCPSDGISSSTLRGLLARGEDYPLLHERLSPAVLAYIRTHELYRA